jgi:signal transduction histidine kinase/DNA-binding response OmpR family regulator/HAMP domain-containing protein
LSKKITVDVKGEILELKNTVNVMVDQLNAFAAEVTRVAREVGTEGKLGGQAKVQGVAGTWKDLTDNVNLMATNLTNQVRGIADVVTAVAQGNLKRKLTVDAKGEIAALAETINFMIETLSTFGDQVTNMAREVGVEGKLGGQARVPGAAGLWRDLTDNVNQLAENLTNQVRSIADVATAVTKGDLTRSIAVEASGEMASLKDNINEMIRNLKDQTLKNAEQDWLKTNLARFSRMLQGERDLATVSNLIMSELAPLVNAQYGVFYVARKDEEETILDLIASYGAESMDELKPSFKPREGLIGQVAADKRGMLLEQVPGDFIRIGSGLGHAKPANVNILPALFEDDVKAVIELASFNEFNETHQNFLDQLMESIGIVLNTIAATMRTEGLLKQSQLLTQELQTRQSELTIKQEELHNTNEELQEKAQLLEIEKKQVEAKNIEIEMARRSIEEKAEQLALTSKYKSEFLANMSHELRTPLNSLLILSKLLADNPQGNLNEKQTEFARTIHSAGADLLNLINDILDLSKIESGTVSIEMGDMPMSGLRQHMERTFRQIAADKGLVFEVDFDPRLPAVIRTDEKRLQQVVLNLLSNAFKFTSQGGVTLSIRCAESGWSATHPVLRSASGVIAVAVKDTGIGIPEDKQKLIFEAFQQADGTTSRKYGGTGLGLSISREIARLLGGELCVRSRPGHGSTFTLFVPLETASNATIAIAEAKDRGDESGTAASAPLAADVEVVDDREALGDDPFVLIVEDDPTFASILLDVARGAGLKGVVSTAGAGTLAMARKLQPDALTLDLGLSDIDGFVLLDLLKHDPQTRHIPIHVISGVDEAEAVVGMGAFSITAKPAEHEELAGVFKNVAEQVHRTRRRVLIAGGSAADRKAIAAAVAGDHLETESAAGIAKAKGKIDSFDGVIVAASEADKALNELKALQASASGAPMIVLAKTDADRMRSVLEPVSGSRTVEIVDGVDALAPRLGPVLRRGRRLADQESVPSTRSVPELAGAKILIVDDDIRNIYSLTSVLESYDVEVLHAERGKEGIAILNETPGVDVALIDIMMPEMDGYETMRQIRERRALADLPLVAVTAKAMKGDRQKCLDAGASDYIAKPVDIELLLALLRVWVARGRDRAASAASASAQRAAE